MLAGITDYIEPPSYITSHRAKQAFIAASTLRQYAWMYAGVEACSSGSNIETTNMQHASLLASRCINTWTFLWP